MMRCDLKSKQQNVTNMAERLEVMSPLASLDLEVTRLARGHLSILFAKMASLGPVVSLLLSRHLAFAFYRL